jgi:hypothetical protein
MEDRILDIDTRRAMGLPPRKLPPSDLKIKQGRVWYNAGIPCNMVELGPGLMVGASVSGHMIWQHGSRYYHHWRP